MSSNTDWLEIPEFLSRKLNPLPPAPGGPREDIASMRQDDVTPITDAALHHDEPAPAPVAPSKPTRKRKAKAGPSKAPKPKLTSKPPKAAVRAKAKDKVKQAKPANRQRAEKDEFGLRKGSVKSRAAAMYASAKGATLGEVKAKLGSIQLNLLNELIGKGFKVIRAKEAGGGNREVTRYHLKSK